MALQSDTKSLTRIAVVGCAVSLCLLSGVFLGVHMLSSESIEVRTDGYEVFAPADAEFEQTCLVSNMGHEAQTERFKTEKAITFLRFPDYSRMSAISFRIYDPQCIPGLERQHLLQGSVAYQS